MGRHCLLRCLRKEIAEFLWVREFQARGVVHFRVLTERPFSHERVAEVWSRALGQLHDDDVRRYGVKVDPISSQGGALSRKSGCRWTTPGPQRRLCQLQSPGHLARRLSIVQYETHGPGSELITEHSPLAAPTALGHARHRRPLSKGVHESGASPDPADWFTAPRAARANMR